MGFFQGKLGLDATVDIRRLKDSDHTTCLAKVFKVDTSAPSATKTHGNALSEKPAAFAIFQDLASVPEEETPRRPPVKQHGTPLTTFREASSRTCDKSQSVHKSPMLPPTPVLGAHADGAREKTFSIFSDNPAATTNRSVKDYAVSRIPVFCENAMPSSAVRGASKAGGGGGLKPRTPIV